MDRGLKFNISAQAYEATITQYQNRQRHYQKWKLQANILDEYKCKTSQQKMGKLKAKMGKKKNHIPWSSWIHPRITKMIQHMQINQCNMLHQQKTKTTQSSQ